MCNFRALIEDVRKRSLLLSLHLWHPSPKHSCCSWRGELTTFTCIFLWSRSHILQTLILIGCLKFCYAVIYTCVETHLVGFKPALLTLHGAFDTLRFSKAAATVTAALAGSGSWADNCAIDPGEAVMKVLCVVLPVCGDIWVIPTTSEDFQCYCCSVHLGFAYNLNARAHKKCLHCGCLCLSFSSSRWTRAVVPLQHAQQRGHATAWGTVCNLGMNPQTGSGWARRSGKGCVG